MENEKNRLDDPIISLRHISKTIKGNQILTDINLDLYGGKVYGFRGKNGSGKTMLMRLMAGLILPTSGEIWIHGKKMHKDLSIPESIGVLLENPAFLDEYTGFQNLKLLASLNLDLSDEEIREILQKVGLSKEGNKKYGKYSLGMKQRLGIASAIMGQPEIILLDEPINAIDGTGVEEICDLILSLRDQQRLIIVSCHAKEELELLSDEIFEMSEGRIRNENAENSAI